MEFDQFLLKIEKSVVFDDEKRYQYYEYSNQNNISHFFNKSHSFQKNQVSCNRIICKKTLVDLFSCSICEGKYCLECIHKEFNYKPKDNEEINIQRIKFICNNCISN